MTKGKRIKPEEIAQYLQDNPHFFDEYADTLAKINVSHPHNSSKVISISERQIITLRDKNQTLQNKLLELIRFGEENDAISEKMHRLALAFLSVKNIDNLLHTISLHLCDDFAVPHCAVRLWKINNKMGHVEFSKTSKDVHDIADSLSQPYCGPHIADEIKCWLSENTDQLRSFAMVPLRQNTSQAIGLLVLGTPEPQRFYPEMGTLHLKRLGELISTALFRHFDTGHFKN